MILTLILMVAASHSQAAVGFMFPQDPRVPQPVRDAGKSIYRVVTQSGDEETLVNLRDPDSLVPFLATLEKPERQWQKTQLMSCLQAGQSLCHIFSKQGMGTGFVQDQSGNLTTNLHVIVEQVSAKYHENPFLDEQERQNAIQDMPLTLALINRDGIVQTSPVQKTPKLNFFAPLPYLLDGGMDHMNSLMARVSDEVEIKMNEKLDEPLPKASAAPNVGESVYLVGYPIATQDRGPLGQMDSDGQHQLVSTGHVISYEDFIARTHAPIPQEFANVFRSQILFTDLDCEHGNSGGPVLNERGEVVGLFMAFHNDAPDRVCIAITNFDKPSLKNLWSSLR